MKKPDKLFRLIRSLSKQEKRYFKIQSTLHIKGGEKNNYVRLFEGIDGMMIYDEDHLRKMFKGEAFLKQLYVLKNRLYEAILRSLESYHTNKNIEYKLRSMLNAIKILYDRSLLYECWDKLRKSKKIAYRYEKLTTILEIMEWERKLMIRESYAGTSKVKLKQFLDEYKKVLNTLGNERSYLKMSSEMAFSFKLGSIRSADDINNMEFIIRNPLMSDETKALTFHAKEQYYNIYAGYYYVKQDYEKMFINDEKHLHLVESYPEFITETPGIYISVMNNYFFSCFFQNRLDKLESVLRKLDALPVKTAYDQLHIFFAVFHQ